MASHGRLFLQDSFAVLDASDTLMDLIEKFTFSFPPWVHKDVMPVALRTILVSTSAEFQGALSSAKMGDHIILANGFYTDIGRVVPTGWPANPNTAALQSPTFPLVIRAASPGGAVLSGNVFTSAQYLSNVLVKDLVVRYSPQFSFYLRDYVRNVRISNCVITGVKEASYIGDNSVGVRLDHLFLSSGLVQGNRGMIIDGPGKLVLGRNRLDSTFIGYRRRHDGNGAEFLQNYGPIQVHRNLVHRYVGEAAEIIKCAQPGCEIANNTIPPEQADGNFPGRLGAQGRIVGNFYLGKPVRAGGYANKEASGNYIENAFMSIGCQAYPCSFLNSQVYHGNTLVNSDIDSDTKENPRAQFKITMKDNIFIGTSWSSTPDIGSSAYSGSGNSWTPSALPSYLASSKMGFNVSAVLASTYFRDEFGIMRPRHRPLDQSRSDPPLYPFDSRVGPSYAPISVRINRLLASEWSFSTARNPASTLVHSDWGFYVWHLEMFAPNGSKANRRGYGIGGGEGFENSASDSGMGEKAGVARGALSVAQDWNAFTVAGWFSTPVSGSNRAILFSMVTPSDLGATPAVELSLSSGTLQLRLKNSANSFTAASPLGSFQEKNKWYFFSVSLNLKRGDVQFWRGSASETPLLLSSTKISSSFGTIPISTNNMVTIGASGDRTNGFVGKIDNVRLWVSEAGPTRFDDPSDSSSDLNQEELVALMRSDLGTFAAYDRSSDISPFLSNTSDPYYIFKWTLSSSSLAFNQINSDGSHNGRTVEPVTFGASYRGFSGASFTGGSSIWHLPHIDVDLRSFGGRTVSLRFAATGSTSGRRVIYEDGTSTKGMILYIFNDTIFAGVWDTSLAISPHKSFVSMPLSSSKRNAWHSVAIVLNTTSVLAPSVAADAFTLFVNGSRVASKPAARFYAHSNMDDGLVIGAHRGSTSFHDVISANGSTAAAYGFDGLIGDFALYNRALGATEIASLNKLPIGPQGSATDGDENEPAAQRIPTTSVSAPVAAGEIPQTSHSSPLPILSIGEPIGIAPASELTITSSAQPIAPSAILIASAAIVLLSRFIRTM